jgi:hypothetical protein
MMNVLISKINTFIYLTALHLNHTIFDLLIPRAFKKLFLARSCGIKTDRSR